MDLSVIICAHNPREDYLRRTLEALKSQTLPLDRWELLLIDNSSKEGLAGKWDLSWHPHGRHVLERELGLTPARLRGIREAGGQLLVFVDDDNVLDASYLETAVEIAGDHPWIGAFSGSIMGEYESEPPDWARFMLPQLAVRQVHSVSWVCCHSEIKAFNWAPSGAGMVIQRAVAEAYSKQVLIDPLRQRLDRVGSSLSSAGDTDMALFACREGKAVGRFPSLSLKHLIPRERLERAYLTRLAEGMSCSHAILRYIWDRKMPDPAPEPTILRRAKDLLRSSYHALRLRLRGTPEHPFVREIQQASDKGVRLAREMLLACVQSETASERASGGPRQDA